MRVVALLTAVATSGCSLVMTTSAPEHVAPGMPRPRCSTSSAPVVGDLVLSGASAFVSLGFGVIALANEESESGYMSLFMFLGSVGFLVSGVVGAGRTGDCQVVQNKWDAMNMQPYGYPPPYGQYPQPYPGQPYPGQPYLGQPNQPQPQPYPGQPYPQR